MAHEAKNPEHGANGAGYEVEDASVREVALTAIGLAVGTIIVCFAVYGLFHVMSTVDAKFRQPMTQMPKVEAFPPEPRLQRAPWQELPELRKREEQLLTSYGWVNKDAGTVRIPIDRAMEMVLERGLPVRSGDEQGGTGRPKTGRATGNVPSQATGVTANAPKK